MQAWAPDHVTGHVAGHVTGQTRFGHVTFPRSRASEVPESRFVTVDYGEDGVVSVAVRKLCD